MNITEINIDKIYNSFGVDAELSEALEAKVITHRNEFYRFSIGKYLEALASLFSYSNLPITFEKSKMEIMLRQQYAVAFGINRLGKSVILGYVNTNFDYTNPQQILNNKIYTGKDISFLIPEKLRLPIKKYQQITNLDDATSGNFIIVQNKKLSLVNDYKILQHYVSELAELEATKMSLIIQAKVMTVFKDENGNESLNQAIQKIYNSSPILKVDPTFDVEESIIKIDNTGLVETLNTVEKTRQEVLAQLNAYFGINVASISKESGISDAEINANLSHVTNNLNVYVESRQQAFDLYNKRFGTYYKVSTDMNPEGEIISNENNSDDK